MVDQEKRKRKRKSLAMLVFSRSFAEVNSKEFLPWKFPGIWVNMFLDFVISMPTILPSRGINRLLDFKIRRSNSC